MNRQDFFDVLRAFKQSPEWRDMQKTVESSPYHREENVASHTLMVVDEYLKLIGYKNHWTAHDMCGALACLFHDSGKPIAEQTKTNVRGHKYTTYSGHEPISARVWENFALTNTTAFTWLMNKDLIFKVGMLIQNHLPYRIKKPHKLTSLAATNYSLFQTNEVFFNMLLSDVRGRVADDHSQMVMTVEHWIKDFDIIVPPVSQCYHSQRDKHCVIMIGASGSGKTTYRINEYANYSVLSLDDIRISTYSSQFSPDLSKHEMYKKCFLAASMDNNFNSIVQLQYQNIINDGKSVVIDNTNLTKKRRQSFISLAREHDYYITAVVFLHKLATVCSRQKQRTSHVVPEDAVKRQYYSMTYPMYGEVDEIIVV